MADEQLLEARQADGRPEKKMDDLRSKTYLADTSALENTPDEKDGDDFTWDYCMVFNCGEEGKIVETLSERGVTKKVEERELYGMEIALVVDKLHDSGLNTKIYKSIQEDEIYCLIGGSEQRLKLEAGRTEFELKLDPKEAFRIAENRGIRLARRTRQCLEGKHQARNCLKENWENLYARYEPAFDSRPPVSPQTIRAGTIGYSRTMLKKPSDYGTVAVEEIYTRYNEGPRHQNSLFRTTDRMKLTISIIQADQAAGGAGIDPSQRNLKGNNNPSLGCFPLHQPIKRDKLLKKWFPPSPWYRFPQPLEEIRDYFGEKIALYFAFLGFYCYALMVPAVLGVAFFIPQLVDGVDYSGVSTFGILIALWATLFFELWKREESRLRVKWGQSDFRHLEQPRPQFNGEWMASPIDGKKVEYYPLTKRIQKEMLSSAVIFTLILAVLGAVAAMFVLRAFWADRSYGSIVVSIINGVQIQIFNFIYGIVAEKLTEWENHRTDTEFEDSLIAKSFLFKFVNSYNGLYYIAFIKAFNEGCITSDGTIKHDPAECFGELRTQLGIVFATIIFMNNSLEYFTPKVMAWIAKRKDVAGIERFETKVQLDTGDLYGLMEDGIETKGNNLRKRTQAEREFSLTEYRTFEDYDELVIQFGFTALFITAFPLTPLIALAGNWFEIWLDSNKICLSMRRPEPKGASDIGTWRSIIDIMVFLIVITNLGVVVFVASDVDKLTNGLPDVSSRSVHIAVFFVVEHILLFFKISIDFMIPDISAKDKEHLQRQRYIINTLVEGIEEDPDTDFYANAFRADSSDVKKLNFDNIDVGLDPNNPHIMKPPEDK